MIDQHDLSKLVNLMPVLQRADANMIDELQRVAYRASIPAGRDIFVLGDQVEAIALLLSGTVRVYKVSDTGREITLYRFSIGQSCILTANAILNHEGFSALATVEEDAEAILIPASHFRDWVNRYQIWRDFVFDLLSQRLLSVMEIVNEVAFGRMDNRVISLLLARATHQQVLTITHQEIADELGSSREVISRILGGLASQQLIQLHRGSIEIVQRDALESYLTM